MSLPEGFKKKDIIQVWYPDLDKLIIETYLQHKVAPKYGSVYNTQASLESSNDVYYLFRCDGSNEWDDEELLDKWIATAEPVVMYNSIYYPHPAAFINKLIRDGHLEAGEYLVQVMW